MQRRMVAVFLVCLMVIGSLATQADAAWSSNRRRAVVLEAFYALRPAHDGVCGVTYNGKCFSNWSYLANDVYAYQDVRSWYGCDSSDWTPPGDITGCGTRTYPVSFYFRPDPYGYGSYGGAVSIGRGGQCKYFANLITYRSGAHTSRLLSYGEMNSPGNNNANLYAVKEGDVVFYIGTPSHTAIATTVYRTNGSVTGFDVVDSNFISDIDGISNREAISKHYVSVQSIYKIFTGTNYYFDPYVP